MTHDLHRSCNETARNRPRLLELRLIINIMGFGASVIAKLLTSSIKHNLFYTIKDKVIEERITGAQVLRKTQKTKIYGSDSTHDERNKLMDILRDRVEYHKDKIISKTIYDELCGLEVKKNGRIEHSTNTHDDQVFSWLWALYVYYEGGDLMNQWGIQRRVLKTDADLEEAVFDIEEPKKDITLDLQGSDIDEEVERQIKAVTDAPGKVLYKEWLKQQDDEDAAALKKVLSTKEGRAAYAKKYHVPEKSLENAGDTGLTEIPSDIFTKFNSDDDMSYTTLKGNLASMWNNLSYR